MFHNTDTEMYIPLGVGDYGNVVHMLPNTGKRKQIYIEWERELKLDGIGWSTETHIRAVMPLA